MGCDGGTIPRRDELVKTKKKPEGKDKDAELAAKWTYCALSCTKLRSPIVSCELGRLYNKDSVIEYLLDREAFSVDVAEHIRNLKDIVELKLTEKTGYEGDKAGNGGQYVDIQNSRYICPVVGIEMSGKYKFAYLRKCGCVLSERALKEVKSDNCHKCGSDFEPLEDVVVINGSDEEISQLKSSMNERRAKAKSEKSKNKKRSKAAEVGAATATTSAETTGEASTSTSSSIGTRVAGSTSNAISTTSKAHYGHIKTAKRSSHAVASAAAAGASKAAKTTKTSTDAMLTEKSKSAYSVAKDPNVSESYKSIFTSHESARNRPKAHWVTYNPLYF